jgi:hypothetical protein
MEKQVIVSNETAQLQGAGQEATYCAVLLDEDGEAVFEEFIVQLYLGTRVVACVYLYRNVYDPNTGDLRVSFQVPDDYAPGTYQMYLHWHSQMDPNTLITYPAGQSPGITYEVAETRKVNVSDEKILHPQAPGQMTSYKAVLLDERGNLLPEKFYVQLFVYSNDLTHIPISEFIGFTDGYTTKFYTSHKPIDPSADVKVYIDDLIVPSTEYTVDYENGLIEFSNPPLKGECCPGAEVTAEYTAITSGIFPLEGVFLSSDVYSNDGVLEFAFKVPEDFKAGTYRVWLGWGSQVIGTLKLEEGTGEDLPLVVTEEERNIIVINEWIELPHLSPGEETSYHATAYDDKYDPLPPTLPAELVLKPIDVSPEPPEQVLAKTFLAPDVYNPITKEVKIAFTVPYVPEGTYKVYLRWLEHVTGGELTP